MVLLLLLLSMEFVGFGFCGWWCFGVAEGFCVVTIVVCVVVVVFVVNNVGVCTCGWCCWWCLWGFGFAASGVVVFVCCFACVRVGHVHPPLFILYFFPGKILSPSREVAWWWQVLTHHTCESESYRFCGKLHYHLHVPHAMR